MRKVKASYASAKAKIVGGIGLGILGFVIREYVAPALTVETVGADGLTTTKSMLNDTMVNGLSLISVAAGLIVLFAGVKEILDAVGDL